MLMTANILAEKLGERVIEYTIPDSIPGFSVIEFALPATNFLPGRAYVIDHFPEATRPSGCVLLTCGPMMEIPGSAVISCAGEIEAIYKAALDTLDDFRHFSDSLTDRLETENDLQHLVGIASDYLQNQLIVIDRSMHILAFSQLEAAQPDENWDYILEHRRLPDQVTERMASLYRQTKSSDAVPSQRLKKGIELYGIPNVHVDLISREVYLGWLVLVANRTPLLPGALDILDQLAKPFAHQMRILHEESKPDLAFHEYYWQELLAGRLENRQLVQAMLKEINWQENDQYRVICLSGTVGGKQDLVSPSLKTAAVRILPRSIVLLENNVLTVILHPVSASDSDDLKPLMLENGLSAGISDLADGISTLPILRIQAEIALQSGLQAAEGGCKIYGDLAVDQLLLSMNQNTAMTAFIHPAIRRMVDSGTVKSRKHFQTLLVYLENERQLLPSAKQLFIHKNTLLYRINNLEQEYSLRLDDPHERLRILLSIKLLLHDQQFL